MVVADICDILAAIFCHHKLTNQIFPSASENLAGPDIALRFATLISGDINFLMDGLKLYFDDFNCDFAYISLRPEIHHFQLSRTLSRNLIIYLLSLFLSVSG